MTIRGDLPASRCADAARAFVNALNETSRRLGFDGLLPPDLHADPAAASSPGREIHRHAFVLPEDLDGDGRLDHLTVVLSRPQGAEAGFSRLGLVLLAACSGFWLAPTAAEAEKRLPGPDIGLAPIFLGERCPLGRDGPARRWRSATPFVPPVPATLAAARALEAEAPTRGKPKHIDPRPARAQLERSLERQGIRGFPRPVEVARIEGPAPPEAYRPAGPAERVWSAFREHNLAETGFWRLTFAEPVEGPIILGALAHLGLGRFVAEA